MNNTGEKKYCDPIKKIKFSKNHLNQIKGIAEAIIDYDPELTKEIYNAADDETEKMFRDIRLNTANQNIQIGDYVI